ncbi:MAG: ribosome silencing factor [Clostridiales bacterium]|nr:ribosome silencing factor [Clostridiales bacterium]MCD7872285.1 ribosome silencing factor [Clostridiales bacterium]
MNSSDIVKIAVKAADSKKGRDIRVIGIRDLSVLADYFVIVTGDSNTQIKALADEIEFKLKEAGEEYYHIEGRQSGWICLDFGSVVIHVFHKEQRQYFQLERLWSDGEMLDTETLLSD